MDLKKIKVETVPNGYVLEIEGQEFMYHSVNRLIRGIAVHLGLMIEEPLSQEYADNLIKAMRDGHLLTRIRQENVRMKREIARLRNETNKKAK